MGAVGNVAAPLQHKQAVRQNRVERAHDVGRREQIVEAPLVVDHVGIAVDGPQIVAVAARVAAVE